MNNESMFPDGIVPKKAFLGDQRTEKLVLPGHIRRIEDWAFAHCKRLQEIWIPKQVESVGRDVFMGCDLLEKMVVYMPDIVTNPEADIFIYQEESTLLALAIRNFFWDGIFDFSKLATKDWYRQYDQHLLEFIKMPDDRNFDPFLAGGEEDYEDPGNNREYYCSLQRQIKCRICMERLIQGKNMDGSVKDVLCEYLRTQEDDMLYELKEKKELAYPYVKCCGMEKILTVANIDKFLQTFSGEVFTECQAYLLQYKAEHMDGTDRDKVWSVFRL